MTQPLGYGYHLNRKGENEMSEIEFGFCCLDTDCDFDGDVIGTIHDNHTITFDCPQCGNENEKDYDPMDFYDEDYDRER